MGGQESFLHPTLQRQQCYQTAVNPLGPSMCILQDLRRKESKSNCSCKQRVSILHVSSNTTCVSEGGKEIYPDLLTKTLNIT